MQKSPSSMLDAATPMAVRGISLIELMIAMTIGMFVLLAMTTIFVNNSQNRRELDKSAQLLENARYAMQILRDELQMAGYYDALSAPPTPADASAVPCTDDLNVLRNSLGLAVIGVNSGGFACLAGEVTTTGTLFIQRAATQTTAAASGAEARDYLQVSFCGDEYETTPFVLAKGKSADFDLRQLDCSATSVAPTRELLRRFLYIDDENLAGDGIPTLKRIDRGDTDAEALVEGIEAMRFEFALDTDGDGSPDTTTETPLNAQWPDVVGVRVWLLARAPYETAGYSSTGPAKTFQLGSVSIDPNEDFDEAVRNFKRHVFSSYVELVNPAGRRQQ